MDRRKSMPEFLGQRMRLIRFIPPNCNNAASPHYYGKMLEIMWSQFNQGFRYAQALVITIDIHCILRTKSRRDLVPFIFVD